MLPPEAYGHRPCDKGPGEAPQREDGDDDRPDQSHLVVLQLDVPALQERLIDKGLDELWEKTRLLKSHRVNQTHSRHTCSQ